MGTLRRVDEATEQATLRSSHLVGRSEHCALRLSNRLVSGEHASLRWTGDAWILRDLGSRNGTWVDERRVQPGEPVTLREGMTLAFGSPEVAWRVISAGAPVVRAEAPGASPVAIDGGMVVLPDLDAPEVVVYCDLRGRWVAERGDGSLQPVGDLTVLEAGGRPWTLHIPKAVEGTLELRDDRVVVVQVRLVIGTDADGELRLEVHLPETGRVLPPRAWHPTLAALARARVADADASPRDQGWRDPARLAVELELDPKTLRDHVYAVRRAFAELGVDDAARAVEQHPDTGWLRLGNVVVELS